MKIKLVCLCALVLIMMQCTAVKPGHVIASQNSYLADIKTQLEIPWPNNRIINLVFHGHSVPSGYAKTPEVRTLDSYPYQLLALLKQRYPYAIINIILTSKGGENSIQGAERFKRDVLIHKPDVLFIDYALNELNTDSAKVHKAWNAMINSALKHHIKVILLTPSPDLRVNLADPNNPLKHHTDQVMELARYHHIGVVNSFGVFNDLFAKGDSLQHYMAQVNHPNQSGNALIANELFKWFK
ncbi:GDSL-type esterase/lipase family protein [Mucilaginibacter sp. UR6-11]|uniref:SGNH/GDSL hydrolase family protein n=1 Tax=Mucilaginibacter sp. UR6-11 TaxID=1435644 RepID=UPI001E3B5151|nr:GDSL-type esterase/lipase family protein [Mucilaginibacter sp. UR6-11]MCC8426011.1 SGNH/GDSL hydrolase family protein [Mucilaginibacter sp. UR6-11]